MKISKLVVIWVLVSLFLMAIVGLFYQQRYQQVWHDNIENTAQSALKQLSYTQLEYQIMGDQIASVINILSNNQQLAQFLIQPNLNDKDEIEQLWFSMVRYQKWYSKIRLIDKLGQEQIKVQFDLQHDKVNLNAPLNDLSTTSLFQQLLRSERPHIEGLGLELHRDQLSNTAIPTPVYRIFSPVYAQQQLGGFLVLDLDLKYFAEQLNPKDISEFSLEVTTLNGDYLYSHEPEKLFGHLIPERAQYNLSRVAPPVWQLLQTQTRGYFYDEQALYAFQVANTGKDNRINLIIEVSEAQLQQRAAQDIRALILESLFVWFGLLVFSLPTLTLVIHYRQSSLESKLARAALDGMTAVMILDKKNRIILVNQAFEKVFGYRREQIERVGSLNAMFAEDERQRIDKVWRALPNMSVWEGEVRCQSRRYREITAIMRVEAIKTTSGQVSYYITSLVDISDRKALEMKLRYLSERDELSKLWNRRKFEEQLTQQSALLQRYPGSPSSCLALVDIDYFKRINDEFGHDEGDKIIAFVAQTIREQLRKTDFVARVGGEEFAIIMPYTTLSAAHLVLERLRLVIEQEAQHGVTVSIGVTEITGDRSDSYKQADLALYDAKSRGRNRTAIKSTPLSEAS